MNKSNNKTQFEFDLYFVYMHTVPNGKIYIGSSCRPFIRWNNGLGYRENKEFYKDIVEYGWDNIQHDILVSCQDYSVALAYEKQYIIMLDAENPNVGYNKTKYKETLNRLLKEKHLYEIGEDNNLFYELYSRNYNPFYVYNIPISEANNLINEWIYNERDREIAKEKFINGKTHNEISKMFEISSRQSANIISNIVKIIEKHI